MVGQADGYIAAQALHALQTHEGNGIVVLVQLATAADATAVFATAVSSHQEGIPKFTSGPACRHGGSGAAASHTPVRGRSAGHEMSARPMPTQHAAMLHVPSSWRSRPPQGGKRSPTSLDFWGYVLCGLLKQSGVDVDSSGFLAVPSSFFHCFVQGAVKREMETSSSPPHRMWFGVAVKTEICCC